MSDRDAPVRFESSEDDVAALLRYLKVEEAGEDAFPRVNPDVTDVPDDNEKRGPAREWRRLQHGRAP